MSEAIGIRLSFAELEEAIIKSEDYTNSLKKELLNRKIKLDNDKLAKISSWIIAEFSIKNCSAINYNNANFFVNDKKYSCDFGYPQNLDIKTNEYGWLFYKYGDESITPNLYRSNRLEEHDKFLINNHELFDSIRIVTNQKQKIFEKYDKYYHLFFKTNYYLALTFLLCSKKIFCKDIAKLIAQKIFFIKLKK